MMADAPSFRPIPARDAWATIRGYVYQVETTVLRWLQLRDDQELELECGEDIDIVQKALVSGEEETNKSIRTLEQVKHREKALTLRSPSAVQALISFHDHLSNNPRIALRFRFVTNAPSGTEGNTAVPGGKPAIEAWQQLAQKDLTPELESSTLDAIRSLLKDAVPQSCAFHVFIISAEDTALLNFIRSFEWSTANPRCEGLQQKIQDELIRMGKVASPEASEQVYDRLFVFTIRTLCQPARKVLNATELNRQISRQDLDRADRNLLELLKTLIGSLESRLAAVEQTSLQSKQLLREVDTRLDQLLRQYPGPEGPQLPATEIPLDVPPSVDLLVGRQSAVSTAVAVHRRAIWYALQGEVGSGKTQFAILIVRDARPQRCLWIGLRNLDSRQCCSQIDSAIAEASGIGPTPDFRTWYEAVCTRLADGTLIVLDDLVRTDGSDPLSVRLQLLAEACHKHGIRMLSTASSSLPPRFVEILGTRLVEDRIPPFTDQDIADLLSLHGAPSEILDENLVSLLGTITGRHPMLLTAAARYLSTQHWTISEQVLQKLFLKEYGKDLNPFTHRLLKTTVPDPESRNLLYRLSIAAPSFSSEDVEAVSEVAPQISLPMERTCELTGLWIQRDSGSDYSLSPLLANLGSADLSSDIRAAVHLALGEGFFRKRKVGPGDVLKAFGHLCESGDLEKTAALLILAFSKLLDFRGFVNDVWGLTDIWADSTISSAVSLSSRLLLRGYQIALRARLGKDNGFLLDDLDSLLESAGEADSMGVVGACSIVSLRLFETHPTRVMRYAVRAIKNARLLRTPTGEPLALPKGGSLEFMLVAAGAAAKTEAQVTAWLSALGQLDTDEIKRTFATEIGEELCCTFCDGIWLRESEKEQPGWLRIHQQLTEIEEKAIELGVELLRAGAVRAKIIVLAEYQKQLEGAMIFARQALRDLRGRPEAEFLINEVTGRQYLYARKWSEALADLEKATRLEIRAFPLLRVRCLLAASQASSHLNRQSALEYCTRAVLLAQSEKRIPKQQVVAAFAEKAIACWYADDRHSALLSCEEAAQRLFECKSDTPQWKELFQLFGHMLGYFCSVSSTGKPPEADFEYLAPQQGWFLIDHPMVAELYDENRDWALAGQLAIFAEALGLDEKADKWAREAVEIGHRSGNPPAAEALLMYSLAQAVSEERFSDALGLALRGALGLKTEWVQHERGKDAAPDAKEREESERLASLMGLVPIFFKVASIWISDHETCRRAANRMADECLAVGNSAARPDLWHSAADILRHSFDESTRWQDLYDKGKASFHENASVQVICYLVASLHASPSTSLQLQLSILPLLEKQLSHYGLYRRIVVPFVRDFWLRSVVVDAYHYRNAGVLREQLLQVLPTPQGEELKEFLRAIAPGLGVTPTGGAGEWLRGLQE